MRICVCAGSFDPPTLGHQDILRRASAMYDKVYCAVLINPRKTGVFTPDERVNLLKKITADLPNVVCESDSGALLDYAKKVGACAVVRGLRNQEDFLYEYQWALVNRQLAPQIEWVYLMSDPAHAHVSSSHVREVGSLGFPLDAFLPQSIVDEVTEKLRGIHK